MRLKTPAQITKLEEKIARLRASEANAEAKATRKDAKAYIAALSAARRLVKHAESGDPSIAAGKILSEIENGAEFFGIVV